MRRMVENSREDARQRELEALRREQGAREREQDAREEALKRQQEVERRAQEDREEARRREEETLRQNEQREYDLRHSALMEMENKYLAEQLAAAKKEKDLITQHEREKADMLISQKMLELEKQKIAEEKLLASQKNVHVETGSRIGSRDQSEEFANKINLQDKIISEVEKQSTSANKLFLQEKIISAQKDSLSHAVSEIDVKINLENKLLLESLMSDADEFISQLDALPVDSLTADTVVDALPVYPVVSSQPLSADLLSLPTQLIDSLGPGPSHGLHTGTPTPAATTTTPLQQQGVNTLAPSSHHLLLAPATATATQPAPTAGHSTLGVHSTTALAHQQPPVLSQLAATQLVYTCLLYTSPSPRD